MGIEEAWLWSGPVSDPHLQLLLGEQRVNQLTHYSCAEKLVVKSGQSGIVTLDLLQVCVNWIYH